MTMTREDIINELNERGYAAEAKETVKNGVTLKGILIKDGTMSPIIYTDKLIKRAEEERMSVMDATNKVVEVFEESTRNCEFDVSNLFERKWVMNHLSIGIQKKSIQKLIKKDIDFLEGLEAYLYIKKKGIDNSNYEVKLNNDHLENLQIFEAEAWEKAYENVCQETVIASMTSVLAELMGSDFEEDDEESPMYVISNKERVKGACSILNKEALKSFAEVKGVKRLFILPSSIHEMLLIPDNGDFEIECLSKMVREVNDTQVDEEEQLQSRAYVLDF